jgi:hypothetical protein
MIKITHKIRPKYNITCLYDQISDHVVKIMLHNTYNPLPRIEHLTTTFI